MAEPIQSRKVSSNFQYVSFKCDLIQAKLPVSIQPRQMNWYRPGLENRPDSTRLDRKVGFDPTKGWKIETHYRKQWTIITGIDRCGTIQRAKMIICGCIFVNAIKVLMFMIEIQHKTIKIVSNASSDLLQSR